MPPIKRTKFKLSTDELMEMFYWLKLIRAFDERLSLLVRQGKVRSGVYTGIGQEAIIVGTCYALRKEDFICPLHRDLGAFLVQELKRVLKMLFAQRARGYIWCVGIVGVANALHRVVARSARRTRS